MDNITDIASSKDSPDSIFMAYLMLILSYLFGGVSLLAWMVFLFWGSLNLIDLGLKESMKIWLNFFLSLAFFIQHSCMIRRSFREWLAKFIKKDYHGAVHTICSGIVLLIVIIFWQKSAYVLAEPKITFRWLLHGIFFVSLAGFLWGIWSLGSFDMFSINPILDYLRRAKPTPPIPFTIRGPYRWVRHPLYSFSILMFWSCPNLSLDRLLYNVLWTIWIIIGTILEERDLTSLFGKEYTDYQKNVPMLIPYRLPSNK